MSPVFIALAIALPVLFVLLAIVISRAAKRHAERETRRKGEAGESYIADLLALCGVGGDVLLGNVVLSNSKTGASTEIDHILLSTRGIFVVETKNLSGDIYGDDEREEWEQVLGDGSIRHTFHSPVMQNAGHVAKVKAITGCDAVESLVVFAKGNTAHIHSAFVYTPAELRAYLNRHPDGILSAKERGEAEGRLRACMAKSVSPEEHRKYIQKKYPKK